MRMHADEAETSVELVRRLLRAQVPEWAALPIEAVGSAGTDNTLYRLGSGMVVRLPRREGDAERLEKERRWLPLLEPLLPLAVPVPLAQGEAGEGYPFAWAVYRWLEGEPADRTALADVMQTAEDLAGLLRALREIDPAGGPAPGAHNAFRGAPLGGRDGDTRAAIAALGDRLDADAATAVWDAALAAPAWDRRPVWIHGDLDARNLLARAWRLSAVIDFGCLGVGDPACDVMVAWKMLPADARARFRQMLAVDDATWARARGWALSQAVGVLSYYTLETNAVLVREAERWLGELLTPRPAR
jgi:aminoglycoside phosphotransferase (APT) family kinase protein